MTEFCTIYIYKKNYTTPAGVGDRKFKSVWIWTECCITFTSQTLV